MRKDRMGTALRYVEAVGLPDRYEPLRFVAEGGMASVWCAEDGLLHRRVAIKLLAPRFSADQVAVARFRREARAAARLSGHPHVVSTFDIAETDAGQPFIVMEHLSGGSVADALRAGVVPADRELAVGWIGQAAAALDHAHTAGVVHRDIKPANLLLDSHRVLRVGDFGIALLASEDTLTRPELVLGTAAYLSPEQALGREATPASDRYSLAVVAFELLTGQRPFGPAPLAAQAHAHVHAPAPAPSTLEPSLPQAVDQVFARGLAKEPAERYGTASAFASALELALGGHDRAGLAGWQPGATLAAWHPRSDERRARRVPAVAALAAAAVLTGAVVLGAGAGGGPAAHRAPAGPGSAMPPQGSAPPPATTQPARASSPPDNARSAAPASPATGSIFDAARPGQAERRGHLRQRHPGAGGAGHGHHGGPDGGGHGDGGD